MECGDLSPLWIAAAPRWGCRCADGLNDDATGSSASAAPPQTKAVPHAGRALHTQAPRMICGEPDTLRTDRVLEMHAFEPLGKVCEIFHKRRFSV
jgi:hypothetical protein